MKDQTVIKLGRLACGTALLVVRAITNVDGTLVIVGLFLLSVPFELIRKNAV